MATSYRNCSITWSLFLATGHGFVQCQLWFIGKSFRRNSVCPLQGSFWVGFISVTPEWVLGNVSSKMNWSDLHSRIWRRQWHPTSVLLPGKFMDRGAWWAAVHGVAKSWTPLSDFAFTFLFHALEKEMATHSSILAWRIPGMGEPGGLPSKGSYRVGHDWSDLA